MGLHSPQRGDPLQVTAGVARTRISMAFVTTYDATDVGQWSGTPYHMAHAFQSAGVRLHFIGPLSETRRSVNHGRRCAYRLLGRHYLPQREPAVARGYARQVAAALESLEADVVFSPGTIPVAQLDCRQPIVIWTDATFAGMAEYYGPYSRLARRSLRQGHSLERAALSRCALAVYSSQWAADSAVENYQVDRRRVVVVPFGSNLEPGFAGEQVEAVVSGRPRDRCRLLLVGVDWQRKGADIAVQAAVELNRAGLPTTLTVVGCRPPREAVLPACVDVLGFISKATAAGRSQLERLFAAAHFFILPTRAEAFGNVLAEASAFALPSLATRTGGLATTIEDGVNGFLFDPAAGPEAYGAAVLELFADAAAYRALALSSFSAYERRLNWRTNCSAVLRLMDELPAG